MDRGISRTWFRVCACVLATAFSQISWASSVFSIENQLSAVGRSFPNGTSNYDSLVEGFLETSPGWKWEGQRFNFEAQLLLRSLQTPINAYPRDPAFLNLAPTGRLFNASNVTLSQSSQTFTDISKLWASYSLPSLQVSIGRRPLGIGVLRVLPVWNRLAVVLPSLSGYLLSQNPDLFDIRWQHQAWTVAGFSVLAQDPNSQIEAVEIVHYGAQLEAHFLIGEWWQQATLGLAGAVDAQGATFRAETFAFAAQNSRPGGIQAGLGFEKALNSRWSVLAEYYHSSIGTDTSSLYLLQTPTLFRALLSSDYFEPSLALQATDFWKLSTAVLINVIDGSLYWMSESAYSFSDHVDLLATVRLPFGGLNQEFGYLPIPGAGNQNLEYPQWVSVSVKASF